MNKYSPSMVDGRIVRLSVSQLSRFDVRETGGCKRKWWYKYIGKIPDPPKQAQQEGIDGHKRLENYFSGQPVVLLDCDVPALELLPKPTDGASPEVQLEKLTCLSIPFQGSMDLVHGRNVYDYKYQNQIRVYAEPTAQLWGYLEEVRRRDDTGGRLSFHHIYIKKRAPYRAQKVTQEFEPREVERSWGYYGSLVKEMHDCAAETDVNKVEANAKACYAYGPCPYISMCSRSNHKEEVEIMSFLDDLAALRKTEAAVTIPEVAAPLKALPPDAPPPDAVPTAPASPPPAAPEVKKRGRPKKLIQDAPTEEQEIPDGRPAVKYLPSPTVPEQRSPGAPLNANVGAGKLKSLRLGLTIGLPEYSSAHVFVEMEGSDEEKMSEEIHAMITRRMEKIIPAYNKALELKKQR